MNKRISKSHIAILLLATLVFNLFACSPPYTNDEILCEYKDLNCLYYVKDEYKKYKYSDYIFDDVSNGMYKKSTPNIADYRTGSGVLDYDIEGYVNARMDYAIKIDLIDKYEIELDQICSKVHDDYFEQRNSYIYFYDKTNKKNTSLYNGIATNISYDDEIPTISFDIEGLNENIEAKEIEGRRIMLSDIIAANTTIDGYMKLILGTGKRRLKFYMDKEIDVEDLVDKNDKIATKSNLN